MSDSNKSPHGRCLFARNCINRAQEYPKNERWIPLSNLMVDVYLQETAYIGHKGIPRTKGWIPLSSKRRRKRWESLTIAFLDSDDEEFCVTGPSPPSVRGRGLFWRRWRIFMVIVASVGVWQETSMSFVPLTRRLPVGELQDSWECLISSLTIVVSLILL